MDTPHCQTDDREDYLVQYEIGMCQLLALANWIDMHFGTRCDGFESGCICCQAHKAFEKLQSIVVKTKPPETEQDREIREAFLRGLDKDD